MEREMPADDEALFKKGMPIRRAVLGAEYVDASMAKADDFMMSFQRATTTWAWGWAWGDATLPRKTRSLLNLAMLTALGRTPEIKLHVKGALNNGITVEEIKATLLHATAYCGIPAGLDAFKAAHEVLLAEGAIKPKEAAPAKAPEEAQGEEVIPHGTRRLRRHRQYGLADGRQPGQGRLRCRGHRHLRRAHGEIRVARSAAMPPPRRRRP
jgi:4-carboxymuconolactone decarboxylase